RQGWQSIELGLRPAIFDRNILALDVTRFAQPLTVSSKHPLSPGVVRRCGGEDADHRHRLLLRASQERIRRRAGENRHEIAASHPQSPHVVDMNYRATGSFPIVGESPASTQNRD